VVEADLTADGRGIAGKGVYDHPSGTWASGRLEFNVHLAKLLLSKLENLMTRAAGLEGVRWKWSLTGRFASTKGEAPAGEPRGPDTGGTS